MLANDPDDECLRLFAEKLALGDAHCTGDEIQKCLHADPEECRKAIDSFTRQKVIAPTGREECYTIDLPLVKALVESSQSGEPDIRKRCFICDWAATLECSQCGRSCCLFHGELIDAAPRAGRFSSYSLRCSLRRFWCLRCLDRNRGTWIMAILAIGAVVMLVLAVAVQYLR